MRLFVAVTLPAETAARVGDFQRALARAAGTRGLRWTKPAHAHFTLKFLGDQPSESVESICAAAREVAKATVAFSIALEGAGGFPDNRRPRVLWIGAGAGSVEMTELAARVDASLAAKGFASEERAFTAHLTLARVKTRDDGVAAARMIECAPPGEVARFRADRFALMQSTSTSEGVVYVPLATFELEPALPGRPEPPPVQRGSGPP